MIDQSLELESDELAQLKKELEQAKRQHCICRLLRTIKTTALVACEYQLQKTTHHQGSRLFYIVASDVDPHLVDILGGILIEILHDRTSLYGVL